MTITEARERIQAIVDRAGTIRAAARIIGCGEVTMHRIRRDSTTKISTALASKIAAVDPDSIEPRLKGGHLDSTAVVQHIQHLIEQGSTYARIERLAGIAPGWACSIVHGRIKSVSEARQQAVLAITPEQAWSEHQQQRQNMLGRPAPPPVILEPWGRTRAKVWGLRDMGMTHEEIATALELPITRVRDALAGRRPGSRHPFVQTAAAIERTRRC